MHSTATPAAWAACLAAFERELTPQQYATWIRPLACAERAGRLKLTAPNRFVLQWVKDRFGTRIETLAREAAGAAVPVDFAVADGAAAPAPQASATLKAATPAPVDSAPPRDGAALPEPSSMAPRPVRRPEPGGLNPGRRRLLPIAQC